MKKNINIVASCVAILLLFCVSGCNQALDGFLSDALPFRSPASYLAGNAGSGTAFLTGSTMSSAQTPAIITQPAGGTVFVDDIITLMTTAEVTDGGTLSYQWYSNASDSNTTGKLINGATRNTFTPPTTKAGTTFYYVTITNTNDGQTAVVASATARVTVNARVNAQAPNITAQPASGAVTVNGSITLSVTATVGDSGTLSYQWFSNTSNSSSGGTQISGATGASYAPPTDTVGDVFYYVTVTNTNVNASGSITAVVTSSVAKVTVNALVNAQTPEIITQPVGDEVLVGSDITLSVNAEITDGGVLSFQWFKVDIKNNSGGTQIEGGTGISYSPPTHEPGETFYYVEITNTNNAVTGEKTAQVISEAAGVVVYTTPGAPVDLIALPSKDEVLVSWRPPEDDGGSEITGYEVSDDYGRSWSGIPKETQYLFTGLVEGNSYTFMVRAVNAAGRGDEASITVIVTGEAVRVTRVRLNVDSLEMLIRERVTLIATVLPEDAEDKSVTWESSDVSVATVSDRGAVFAQSAGFAIITVTTNDGRFRASCNVTVRDNSGSGGVVLLLILLGILAVGGAAAGVYFWQRKKKKRGKTGKSGNAANRGSVGERGNTGKDGVTSDLGDPYITGDLYNREDLNNRGETYRIGDRYKYGDLNNPEDTSYNLWDPHDREDLHRHGDPHSRRDPHDREDPHRR